MADQRGHDLDPRSARERKRLPDVVGTAIRGADEPDPRSLRQPGDLVDELDVGRADQHGHDRDAAGRQRLGLVGMERGGRHEVVVEPVEPLGQVVEERALRLDHARELVDQPLGVIARVGVRALGEQDPDERPGSPPLGRRGERGGRQLVGGEAGLRGPAQHLGDDAGQGLRTAPLRRSLGHVRPGPVSTGDVAGVGQTTIDRPDGVGVHSQCRTKLAHGRQPRAGQQSTGIDLVRELPVDLGRDGDVGVTLDIERAASRASPDPDLAVVHIHSLLVHGPRPWPSERYQAR